MAVGQLLMEWDIYTFDGKVYQQMDRGPTGTRIAMAVGQLLMEWVIYTFDGKVYQQMDGGPQAPALRWL